MKLIGIAAHGEVSTGFLTAPDLPFEVKRVYYIYGVPEGMRRGGHAHRRMRQVFFCLRGKVQFEMDDGKVVQTGVLNHPAEWLLVEPLEWHWMTYSGDAVVMAIGSELYDEAEYIRDYSEFKGLRKKGKA